MVVIVMLVFHSGKSIMNKPIKYSGFGLAELAIGILLLGVVSLGIVRLNVGSSQNSGRVVRQVNIQQLGQFIYQRMQANLSAGSAGNYLETNYSDHNSILTNCSTSSCSQANRAAYDLYEWKQQFSLGNSGVSGLVGVVCRSQLNAIPTVDSPNCSGASSDPMVIKMAWDSGVASDKNYLIIKAPETIGLQMKSN